MAVYLRFRFYHIAYAYYLLISIILYMDVYLMFLYYYDFRKKTKTHNKYKTMFYHGQFGAAKYVLYYNVSKKAVLVILTGGHGGTSAAK